MAIAEGSFSYKALYRIFVFIYSQGKSCEHSRDLLVFMKLVESVCLDGFLWSNFSPKFQEFCWLFSFISSGAVYANKFVQLYIQ